ncbi:MAG: glycosyltransferase family 39 protein [Chitinophagaceae bacterium]|nr:glycosyltransferase family 39 protein [Chitinophagaceae bacterium]
MSNHQLDYKKRTIQLIIVATALRLLLATIAELNNDEAHYWTYGKHLQWNYFDHPPMIAVWIRFFTAGLQWNHELFIRLGSVLGAALSTWLMYLIGKKLKDEYTGFIAACLYTASFYSSIIAGVLILPDSPQLVFWLLSVCLMADIIKSASISNYKLLLLGVAIGFCILSKVHGVFCWAGFIAYCLFNKRSVFKNPFLYISILVTLVMLVPSFIWSMNNQFSTYDYHSNRIIIRHVQIDSFFGELFGSFLYNNPVNIVLLIMALFYFRMNPSSPERSGRTLILWLGIPLIATVLFLSIFNDTLPHWSGPAYTTLIPITAMYLSARSILFTRRSLKYAIGLTAFALVVAFSIINFWPGTLGSKSMPDYGKNDVTLDMTGWRQFGNDFSNYYKKEAALNNKKPKYIFSNYWFPAGHLDFYVAHPMNINVIGFGRVQDIHHFAWLNKYLPPLQQGDWAYYITISNFNEPPPQKLIENFREVSTPVLIKQMRNGAIARYFYVYALKGYKGN